MGRKTRKALLDSGKPKFTRYDDAAPRWIRKLAEDIEKLADLLPQEKEWQTPRRVNIMYSTKDEAKEEYRNVIIRKRKGRRSNSARIDK